jgi:hypothetical protein
MPNEAGESPLSRPEILGLSGLVLVGVSLRLVRITGPFVEHWAWREADVAMIAENFYRHGFNLLYPQINWAGDAPGYVGTEFPLVPFLAAIGYLIFGVHEWIGRAVSVGFFAASVPVFYLLVRKVFGRESAAFAASIYVLVPLGIFSSRCFMSDMPSLSLSIMAVYLFSEWLDRTDRWLLIGATTAMTLGILVKLPAIIIGLPLLYMAWQRYRRGLIRQKSIWIFAAGTLIPPAMWYGHAYLVSVWHPPYHFFGSGGTGILAPSRYAAIARYALVDGLTPLVTAAMLLGLLLPSRGPFRWVFHWWLVATCAFVLFAGPGQRHPWYQLPLVAIAPALAGRACEWAWQRSARRPSVRMAAGGALAIFLGATAYLAHAYVRPLYTPWAIPLFSAGRELDRIAGPDALVVVADYGVPTGLYYARRHGWHFPQGAVSTEEKYPFNGPDAVAELERRRQQGASYVAFPAHAREFFASPAYEDVVTYLASRSRRMRWTADYAIFSFALADQATGLAAPTSASRPDGEFRCFRREAALSAVETAVTQRWLSSPWWIHRPRSQAFVRVYPWRSESVVTGPCTGAGASL